jgi:hypothetical protein
MSPYNGKSREYFELRKQVGVHRELYDQNLGISFKEESGGYLHTEALKEPRLSLFGHFLRWHSHVLVGILGPTTFLSLQSAT